MADLSSIALIAGKLPLPLQAQHFSSLGGGETGRASDFEGSDPFSGTGQLLELGGGEVERAVVLVKDRGEELQAPTDWGSEAGGLLGSG